MADAAFEWATARNLVRISPIHQEAEAKLVLGESFCVKDEHGTSTTENARMDLEDTSGSIFDNSGINVNSSVDDILKHGLGDGSADPAEAALVNSGSFKNIKAVKNTSGVSVEDENDLADELLVGFEEGAESAARVVRLARVANNRLMKHGLADPLLSRMARCAKSRSDSHACRNLHRAIKAFGKEPSMCSRLLYTVLPSPYTKRALFDLLRAWVTDLNSMTDEWWDFKNRVKNLRPCDTNPNPYKNHRSPLEGLRFFAGPKFIRIDPAHTYAIDGVGKNFCASGLVVLMLAGWFGNGSPERKFDQAYHRFTAFCKTHGKRTSIKEFSYKCLKLPVGSLRGSPRGLGKGQDAGAVGAWLLNELEQIDLTSIEHEWRDTLEVLRWACAGINRFWRSVYGHGLWLGRDEASALIEDGWTFVEGYATLATMCSRRGMRSFYIRPKMHMFAHLLLDLKYSLQGEQCHFVINPACHCTWSDEDYIGRIARISRRTHPSSAPANTIKRSLGYYRREFSKEFGKLYMRSPAARDH
ncbi:unnamed protein product [Durusdinium trenchii]|uniref:Uncharacterized protein n=2 Tax=Durusdinium trenchii TaxID=1381693 RepID=A0ABP0LX22_9DINO